VQCRGLIHWINLQHCRLQHCKSIGLIHDVLICNIADQCCSKLQSIVTAAIACQHSPSKRHPQKNCDDKGTMACTQKGQRQRKQCCLAPWGHTNETPMSRGHKKSHDNKGSMSCTPKRTMAAQTMSRGPKRPQRKAAAMNHQCLAAAKKCDNERLMLCAPKKDHGKAKQCRMAQKAMPTKHQHCVAFFRDDKAGMKWAPKSATAMQNNVAAPKSVATNHQHGTASKKATMTKQECCGLQKGLWQHKMTTLLLTCYFFAFRNSKFFPFSGTELGMYTAFPELKFFVLVLGHLYGIRVVEKYLVRTC